MKTLRQRIASFHFGPVTFPVFLLALCLLAYAPYITRLGFYWDDFPISWIAATMGPSGLARYFSTNRPVWGLIYQLTTSLLGSKPILWQAFALLMRWTTGVALWALLRAVWPARYNEPTPSEAAPQAHPRETFAAWAAALFVLYPGFRQQPISVVYSHFFVILTVYLLSFVLMVQAIRQPRRFWLFFTASLLLSLLNLLAMEYFFLLDFLRPLFLWVLFSESAAPCFIANRIQRLRRTVLLWVPYLVIFGIAIFWRSVMVGFHTYEPVFMNHLKQQPLQTLLDLFEKAFHDVWLTSVGAWVQAFTIPSAVEIGAHNVQRYGLLVAAGALIALAYLLLYRGHSPMDQTRRPFGRVWQSQRAWALQPALIGLVALFVAGGPFWLTDLPVGLTFPNDRFTLSFMLGASLLAAALLTLLPIWRWGQVGLFSIAIGFAVGLQMSNAVSYTTDWSAQRSMFWQMTWRMPDLQPGTTLLINELPVTHYTDNSLTAPLNWTYDPQNNPQEMQYALFYPTLRKETYLGSFQKDQPINLDYLATNFHGNTSQMVALSFTPPGCVRVLDPEIDVFNWMLPLYLRESLTRSTTAPILSTPVHGKAAPRPPEHIYGNEIAHGWCYYFEKADLARQNQDWAQVAALGDQAAQVNDYPNDPLERFPFIEGYAHTNDWEKALTLTRQASAVSPVVMQPMVCKLWERIDRDTPASPQKANSLSKVREELNCSRLVK
jgi:hypothetical protein